MTSESGQKRPLGRQLPPPKPKHRGYRPPAERPAADDDVGSQNTVSSFGPRGLTDPIGSARVTIYSDARIEHWLDEVRVQSAIVRLDLTHSAVWRRAMYDLIDRFTPEQIVREFQTQDDRADKVRPGRPRR